MANIEKQNNSYGNILKATSLFGGVQAYTIIIQILRSKFAAVLLGPTGMGIMGLLNSTVEMVSSATNCGLATSAVRNIADASKQGDEDRLRVVISVFRRLVWITGIIGTLICVVFCKQLSELAFGNTRYSWAILILSVNVLFLQFKSCQASVLQGLQRYRDMAKCSVYGATLGLAIIIPLYYTWGMDAIVPVLLITHFISFLLTFIFYKKVKIKTVKVSYSTAKTVGFDMLKMGILISLSSILGLASAYLLKVFIGRFGSLEDVGLFNAGFTMVESYVGLVFTAMAKDYYPRLSKIAKDNIQFSDAINKQAEISIILLFPIVVLFVVFAKLLVLILYSESFLAIEKLIYWAISAIIIKSMAWSLSYSILAKGASRLFFNTEIVAVIYGFVLNVLGYYFFGLTGLGISYFIKYVIYFIQLSIVLKHNYNFMFQRKALFLAGFTMIVVIAALMTKIIGNEIISYIVGSIIVAFSLLYSYRELNKRVAVSRFVKEKLWKKK